MQRGMRRAGFEQFEVFSSDRLDTLWQAGKERPESGGGAMHLQILESSLGLLLMGLTHQEIEPPSLRVGSDFLVPSFPVLCRQPAKDLGELLPGKTLDLRLQFVYS